MTPLPGASPPPAAISAASVLVVRDLGKAHRIYGRPPDRLKQMLLARFGRRYGHDFWALRHVSFDVARGTTLGIIGRNGSGKSTLLQILAGTMAPSEGEVLMSGRIAALLELGSGFNPEFTGRENAVLNGAILGISRREMDARLDDIAAFADIGEFLDQPVKVYSSGMFVRLAFAVAVNVDADILLIDEALAVGDVFFQQKCYRRLEALRDRGVTVLLVSHSMGDIEHFCQRVVVLDAGSAVFQGEPREAVRRYYLLEQHASEGLPGGKSTAGALPVRPVPSAERWDGSPPEAFLDISRVPQVSNGGARCTGVALSDGQGRPRRSFVPGETARISFEFELLADLKNPVGGVTIYNGKAVLVHGRNTLQYGVGPPAGAPQGSRVRFRQDIRLALGPDDYTFEVGLATLEGDQLRHVCHLPAAGGFTVSLPAGVKEARHYGVADLSGECRVLVLPPAPRGKEPDPEDD